MPLVLRFEMRSGRELAEESKKFFAGAFKKIEALKKHFGE